jgi:prophage regulatory protein
MRRHVFNLLAQCRQELGLCMSNLQNLPTASSGPLWRRPAVRAYTGVSDTTLDRLIAASKFPRPVPLGSGRAVAWVSTEVVAWVEARIAERDSQLEAA